MLRITCVVFTLFSLLALNCEAQLSQRRPQGTLTFKELAAKHGIEIPTTASKAKKAPPRTRLDDLISPSKPVAAPAPRQVPKTPLDELVSHKPKKAVPSPKNNKQGANSQQEHSETYESPRHHASQPQSGGKLHSEPKRYSDNFPQEKPEHQGHQSHVQKHPPQQHGPNPYAEQHHSLYEHKQQPREAQHGPNPYLHGHTHPQPKQPERQQSRPECGYSCTANYEPVCGVKEDGTTKEFSNQCNYGGHVSCHPESGFVRMEKGTCDLVGDSSKSREQKAKECLAKIECSRAQKGKICAYKRDGTMETFENDCIFLATRKCMPDIYTGGMELGYCGQDPETICRSYHCPHTNDPVCGINPDGSTREFGTQCEYNGWSKCNPGEFEKLFVGSCRAYKLERMTEVEKARQMEIDECVSKHNCGQKYNPMCARKVDGTYERFPNQCEYEAHAECDPEVYTTLVRGDCPETNTPLPNGQKLQSRADVDKCIAESDVDQCTKGVEPVCNMKSTGMKETVPSKCEFEILRKCDPNNYDREHKEGECLNYNYGHSGHHQGHAGQQSQQHGHVNTPQAHHNQAHQSQHVQNQHRLPASQNHGHQPQYGAGITSSVERCKKESPCPTTHDGMCALRKDGSQEWFSNRCRFEHAKTCESGAYTGQTRPAQGITECQQSSQAQHSQQHGHVNTPQAHHNQAHQSQHVQNQYRLPASQNHGHQPQYEAGITSSVERCKKESPCPTTHDGMCALRKDGSQEWFSNRCRFEHAKTCESGAYTGQTRSAQGITECQQSYQAQHSQQYGHPVQHNQYQHGQSASQNGAGIVSQVDQCKSQSSCPMIHDGMCALRKDGSQEWFSNHCRFEHAKTCESGAYTGHTRPAQGITECQQSSQAQHSQQHGHQVQHNQHQHGQSVSRDHGDEQVAQHEGEASQVDQCKSQSHCPMIHDGMCALRKDGSQEWFSNRCRYEHAKTCEPEAYSGKSRPAESITDCH